MPKSDRTPPSECPCCYQPFDGEHVYWADGAYNCRLCRVQFQSQHAEPAMWYFLLTSDLSSRFDRIDDAESIARQRLDRAAEKMNANLRHNARKARVIERGELGREREACPTTLAEVFFGKGTPSPTLPDPAIMAQLDDEERATAEFHRGRRSGEAGRAAQHTNDDVPF